MILLSACLAAACFCHRSFAAPHSFSDTIPLPAPLAYQWQMALLLATWFRPVSSTFEMTFNGFIVHERLDPIVSPGTISSHAHSVFGGSGFMADKLTTKSLQEAECTGAPIKEDKSNYWVPTLYFQKKDGTFQSVDGGVPRVYYFTPTTDEYSGKISAFPDDFQMLIGDPTRREFHATDVAANVLGYRCAGGPLDNNVFNNLPVMGDQGFSPDKCNDGLRMEVRFPACWDGKNAQADDHISHVAYGNSGNIVARGVSFDCPSTHPVVIPRVFLEIYWQIKDLDYTQAKNQSQPLSLANGDTTGYGLHGDFANGWPRETLQKALDDPTCRNSQQFKDCSMLTFQLDNTCFKTTEVNEVVTGNLDALPGCNPVFTDDNGKTNCGEKIGFLRPTQVVTSGAQTATGVGCPPGKQQNGCSSIEATGAATGDPSSASAVTLQNTNPPATQSSNNDDGNSKTSTSIEQQEASTTALGGWKHVNMFRQCRPKPADGILRRLAKRYLYHVKA